VSSRSISIRSLRHLRRRHPSIGDVRRQD